MSEIMSDTNTQISGGIRRMTEGSPFRLILRFMIPVLLGQLVQQTYNMVDSIIVGRLLGASALAAVGASSSVQFMVIGFCSGACDGFAIPVAQRFGARKMQEMRRYIYHTVILTILCAAVLTTATAILCPQIIQVLHTPEGIRRDADQYLLIIFLGLPFTFFYNMQASLLRAVGNSREPFLFLAIAASLNIFLDLFCVAVLKWGVSGAAVATITSQALSGLMCLLYIARSMKLLHPQKEDRVWSGRYARNLLVMGLPMGLQFSITAIGSMVMQACNNSLGSLYVAGYTAGDRIEQFVMCPYVALSSSIATYVGQNFGAGKYDRIRKGVREGFLMGLLYGVIFGSLMALTGREIAMLFLNKSPDSARILDITAQFLKTVGFTFWLVTSVNVFRPAIQGMGQPGKAIFSGVIEMIARTAFALGTLPVLGFTTICWTHQAAWITAGLYVLLMFRAIIRKTSS
ncbi:MULTISPECIES: MATE family efflux transporter [unclassified Bilifractor]|uniref:MATE family efflux transporter n=1 Tax=unclassified Bilifractor TaxID=2815795 RepID=UPI003F92CDB5